MKSKLILLLTFFFIGFLESCKKEDITETTQVNKPAKTKYIEQADAFLRSYYNAGSLNELDIDASIIYKLDSGRFMVLVPFRVERTKNFVLISADTINGFKKGLLLHIDKSSNTAKGEKFNGTITIREMNGNLKEVRKIVNGYRINTTNRTSLVAIVLPEVVVISYVSSGGSIGWADWYNLLYMFEANVSDNWYFTVAETGGGGGSEYTADPNSIEINFDEVYTEPVDLSKYLNCFNQIQNLGATYLIKICAQLPIDNDPSKILDNLATGHAFLTATKTNESASITQNFGFYPENGPKSLILLPVPSKIGDNDFTKYNASLTISVTYDQFSTFMQTAMALSTLKYDLNNFNCTNFALECFNSFMGVNDQLIVPDYIYNGINYKTTPNKLYETLLKKKNNGVPNIDIGVKYSSSSHGACN